ncbi:MAG TPA: hypothetical protein VGO43_15950 [Pyrinomonadaceae bacterium]|jgi:hypothetical protein|nr:hypothetical protein [Pyrinomonadaceae bacterium]
MTDNKIEVLTVFLIVAAPMLLFGQSKRQTSAKKPIAKPVPTAAATPTTAAPSLPTQSVPDPPKKNGRPSDQKAVESARNIPAYQPVYTYTFDRPGFVYSKIKIEHDEDGKGRIWFTRDGNDQPYDDPLTLSLATMERLKAAFSGLNFLDSLEDYQYATHDYSNMGNVAITMNRSGRTRTAKYNWTDNKQAKALMDIYRAISNEATWKLEMSSAHDNQPLLTPGLVDTLQSYLDRSEISDPPHLVPYLTQLSTDERLPLIARNHLTRIIAQIAKAKH